MDDQVKIDRYLDAVVEASKRSRTIVLIIVTASVLSFAAFLSSRIGSWPDERLRTAKLAQEYFSIPDSMRKPLPNIENTNPQYFRYSFTKDEIEKVDKFMKAYEVTDSAQLHKLVDDFNGMLVEHVIMIRIPFFGATFDVNDLGIISGLSFVVLLTMFRFSLTREITNLKFAFSAVKDPEAKRYCYNYLSMGQFLTIPQQLGGKTNEKFWTNIPKVLLALPFVCHLLIFINDLGSLKFGWVFSFGNTLTLLLISSFSLGVIIILTVACYSLLARLDNEWRQQKNYIGVGGNNNALV